MESIALVKYNFHRLGGFSTTTNYRKIPRDTIRVGMLYLSSEINNLLVNKEKDKRKYLEILLSIHEGLKVLDKHDIHRT